MIQMKLNDKSKLDIDKLSPQLLQRWAQDTQKRQENVKKMQQSMSVLLMACQNSILVKNSERSEERDKEKQRLVQENYFLQGKISQLTRELQDFSMKREKNEKNYQQFKYYKNFHNKLQTELQQLSVAAMINSCEMDKNRFEEDEIAKITAFHQSNITDISKVYAKEKEILEKRLMKNQDVIARYQKLILKKSNSKQADAYNLIESLRQQLRTKKAKRDEQMGGRLAQIRSVQSNMFQSYKQSQKGEEVRNSCSINRLGKMSKSIQPYQRFQRQQRKSCFIENPISLNFQRDQLDDTRCKDIHNFSSIATQLLCQFCNNSMTPNEFIMHVERCREEHQLNQESSIETSQTLDLYGQSIKTGEKVNLKNQIHNLIKALTKCSKKEVRRNREMELCRR